MSFCSQGGGGGYGVGRVAVYEGGSGVEGVSALWRCVCARVSALGVVCPRHPPPPPPPRDGHCRGRYTYPNGMQSSLNLLLDASAKIS